MSVKHLKHGIKVMRWRKTSSSPTYIFASSKGFYGRLILLFRGYKPHKTILGTVFRKDL